VLTAVLIYAAIALIANWPTWPGDPNRIRAGDLEQMVWFLAWTPYAILHHHNVLYTTWINYPRGINLAQNTSSPLLGILSAPLTLLVSPIASLNLLLWLAFPLSASSMFFVLRRWVRWDLAAFVGGALYGFSPYVVTQGFDHLNLAFVPLPPLILLAIYETLRPDSNSAGRWGIALGLLVVAQFFISPEIAATTVLVAGVALVVLAVARPHLMLPSIHRGLPGLVLSVAIVGICLAYPISVMLAGPYRFHGPAYPGGVSADLLGTLAPTAMQRFAPGGLSMQGSRLLFGNISENGSYLGLPLLALLVVVLVRCRRRSWIRFAASMVAITVILSLGSHLIVANHRTPIPLPWDLLQHLPFADDVIVVRLSLYTALFASLMIALGIDELHTRWKDRSRSIGAVTQFQRHPLAWGWALGVLAVASVLSLVPSWPFPTAPAEVPSYFSGLAVDRIPPGSVALISPYPSVAELQPQMWQAVAGMRFRIIGGYGLVADAAGTSSNFPAVLQPEDVQRFLWNNATGGTPYPLGTVPQNSTRLACQLRVFLKTHHVDTVISTTSGAEPQRIRALFERALGQPSGNHGAVNVWYGVQNDVWRGSLPCPS